jgi:putative ABC transport system permease protein
MISGKEGARVKFLPLVWSEVWRNPSRTLLLLLQVGVAFTLFGLLNGMNSALKLAVTKQRADVLYVTNRVNSNDDLLPLHYEQKIGALPGVLVVTPQNYLVGEYQSPNQQVIAVATDPRKYFAYNTYLKVADDQVSATQKLRTAAIAGAALAHKYGWKVGDRVSLNTGTLLKDGSGTWTFDIVGIYDNPEGPDLSTVLIINNDYLDQARAEPTNSVARFVVKVAEGKDVPNVIDSIDNLFANSSFETATVSENENAQTRLRSLGNLDLIARAVTAAAFSALLLSVGTTLVYAIRQRTRELGVMKALGFSNRALVTLVIVEVVLVMVIGALLGLLAAWRVLPLARQYAGNIAMPAQVVVSGIGCAVVIALVCAWLPARHAVRLRVVEALAKP